MVGAAGVARGASFALRVKGDSMIGAGIRQGDYVVVRPRVSAGNGVIVVLYASLKELRLRRFDESVVPRTLMASASIASIRRCSLEKRTNQFEELARQDYLLAGMIDRFYFDNFDERLNGSHG